jgi:predicted dinucleotide-binding enzyme
MRVSILGTGTMARAIATRALAGGHSVTFTGTHIDKARDLADELTGLGDVEGAEEVGGDVVVLAVPFTQAPHALRQHAPELDGAVVVDVTNPVDVSVMRPLDTSPFDSGARLLAVEAPPGSPLVKAFNTTFAGPLLVGELDGRPLDVFLAGDDQAANDRVAELVRSTGLRPVDAGGLDRARELEAMGLLHMAIQGPLGTRFTSALEVLP